MKQLGTTNPPPLPPVDITAQCRIIPLPSPATVQWNIMIRPGAKPQMSRALTTINITVMPPQLIPFLTHQPAPVLTEFFNKIMTLFFLTHYQAHSVQVFAQDHPQSPQAWVRGQQYCAPGPQRNGDRDIFHHECKAVHTQPHGLQNFQGYQPSTL